MGMQTEFVKRHTKQLWVCPQSYSSGVSPKSAYWVNSPLGWHIVSINKKSPNIDAAVRVFEVLIDRILSSNAWGSFEYFVHRMVQKS